MKSSVTSLLALLVLVAPATAETIRHHHRHHGRHVVGTTPHHGQPGFPITAAQDSIRINAVGEVISQPVPVIQKERNFDARAQRNLAKPQPAAPLTPPMPATTPAPQP